MLQTDKLRPGRMEHIRVKQTTQRGKIVLAVLGTPLWTPT
jgi:hypothetical protein